MKRIAFVPMRSGSKGIKDKNINDFCGKPLAQWTLESLLISSAIDEVVIAVDSEYIAYFSSLLSKIDTTQKSTIYARSDKNARDDSTTEDVILEYINNVYDKPKWSTDRFMLVQVTNPFLIVQDVDNVLEEFETNMSLNSMISCVPYKRFIWKKYGDKVESINYNYHERPLRQWWNGDEYVIENGSFYLSTIKNIWLSKNRVSGKIGSYLMPEYSLVEIDNDNDWLLAEKIFRENMLGG